MDPDPTLLQKIAKESGTSPKQVGATLDLLEKQAAIPFIARYRKEATGNLDEPRIRRIAECHGRYRAFLKRRRLILSRIEDQDKLSDELKEQLLACYDKNRLEDLYAPFKRKERKEASAAREKGLESLAKQLWEQETGEFSIDAFSEKHLSEEKGVATKEEAIEGALAIVARWIADDAAIRGALRRLMSSEGKVVSKVVAGKAGEKTKYDSFYDFSEEISRIPFHRVTALRRGVREGILTLEIELDDQKALQVIRDKTIRQSDSPCAPFLERAIRDAYLHSLKPLLQAEVRSNLKERTDNEALKLFQANLANLLLAPPLGSVAVMGMDPGARSACRITVIDANGAYREHATLAPGLPRKNSDRAEAILYRLIQRHGTHAIAIGNGVGSRETERFVRSFLTKYHAGHSFDLSLVRGKTAKPEAASRKEEDVNGRAESEPSGLAAGSRPSSTEAAEEPNSSREESLPEANPDEAGAVSAPIQEKADADTNRESAAVRPSSEEVSALTASTAAEGAEGPANENSRQNGDPNSASPVEDGTPEATEVSAPIQEKADADTNRESANSGPSSEEVSAPTASTAADGAESPADENSRQNGDPNSASPVEDGTPEATKAAPTPTASESPRSETTPSQRPSIFSAIVHKGGTGAYASSEAARKEFPRLDLGFRGAVSIARRMQDPLAELAKIQPKAILAGSDLQEVEPKRLKRTLEGTLESCINQVGLDVNTAPVQLLARVAGLNAALARSIVEHRRKHGPFSSRSQLMEVPGITEARFEQSAGFLRVPGGEQPLDGTAIHPECYDLVEEMAGSVQATVAELFERPEKLKALDLEKLSNDRFGLPTLQDIRRELSRRGRDRRKAFVPPSFREDVKEVSDLQKGMLVEGTVSNVTSFGAFVDIGVQQEGLVHISELSNRFVRDANQAVHVGQVVKAKVIGVDTATNRISLSIKALRVSENSRKRKKKPLKTASRPPAPKPKHASAGEKGNHQEVRRSGRPERRPSGPKGRQIKKRQATAVKTTAIRPKRPKPPEADVLPDTSNLSFSEKIRLLQEKFSGIR